MVHWEHKEFHALNGAQAHEILRVRQTVFIVEQQLLCEDADELDLTSLHLLGRDEASQNLVAYARIHPPNTKYPEASFGRVLVTLPFRNTGLGKRLVARCIDLCSSEFPRSDILISAQLELQAFYENYHFRTLGEPYMEAGIQHINMLKRHS